MLRRNNFRQNKDKIVCFVCGSHSHFARNCGKRFQRLESKENIPPRHENSVNTAHSHTPINQGSFTSSLKYVDLFIDGIQMLTLVHPGCEILTLNRNNVSARKQKISRVTLSSCFNENKIADLVHFAVSVSPDSEIQWIKGAVVDGLACDAIIPEKFYRNLIELPSSVKVSYGNGNFNSCVEGVSSGNKTSVEGENNNHQPLCKRDLNYSSVLENDPNETYLNFLVNMELSEDENNIDLFHLTDSALKEKLRKLINNYKPNKTETTNLKMLIILTDDIPVCQRSRRLSFFEKCEVEKQINEWLGREIIRESCSDYCSSIVLCKKKEW